MEYESRLIHVKNSLELSEGMYALICLRASGLSMTLSGVRCFLDGTYLLCLSQDDRLTVHGGNYEAINLQFLPYFYNVNLSHNVIGLSMYEEMRSRYGYPDFHLFRLRDERFCGILPLTEEAYENVRDIFRLAGTHIADHPTDIMWSCRTRSDMIAILRIAEGAYTGEDTEPGSDVLRWIRGNLEKPITLDSLCTRFHTNRTTLSRQIRQRTGFSPMQYVLEERLNQSRPDLLFTWVSIGEIAEKYGFSDANYYIRAFKKRFGVTPRQYRTQGREERIRNEKLYHERERNMMKPEEFREYIDKGLGCAVLLLRKEEDPGRFEEILWTHLTEPKPNHVMPGIYEKKLIDCLPRAEEFRARLAAHYLPMLEHSGERRLFRFPFKLLIHCGYGEPIRQWAQREYPVSYAEMLEQTKRGGSEEKHPAWATRYRDAAAALGSYFADEAGIRRILTDLADLYAYTDAPAVPGYQNPLYNILGERGKAFLYPLMDEIAESHPHGERIHLRNELRPIVRPEPAENLTWEKLLEGANMPFHQSLSLKYAFAESEQTLIRQAAERAMDETDPGMRRYLLSLFIGERLPREYSYTPPAFPLSPEKLLEEAKGYMRDGDWRNKENGGIPFAVMGVLSWTRHPLVLRWSKELLLQIPPQTDHGTDEAALRAFALEMRWGANYTARDKGELAALLRMTDSPDFDTVVRIFINGIRLETPDLPLDMIGTVFHAVEPNLRMELTEELAEKNLLPKELREECRHDAWAGIRRTVEEFEGL